MLGGLSWAVVSVNGGGGISLPRSRTRRQQRNKEKIAITFLGLKLMIFTSCGPGHLAIPALRMAL